MNVFYRPGDDADLNEAERVRLRALKAANNPKREATGHYTGRCKRCGSNKLWDDNLHYGCNTCGVVLM